MSSRKKAKGKERRAKAAERPAPWRGHGIVPPMWEHYARCGEKHEERECSHGFDIPLRGDACRNDVNSFMETLYAALQKNAGHMLASMKTTYELHPQVWNDVTLRKMVVGILLRTGTNFVLTKREAFSYDVPEDVEDMAVQMAQHFAVAALFLDRYDGKDFRSATGEVIGKSRDMLGGGARDAIKFYNKRIPCSCLKEKYSDAKKTLPKVGKCHYCDQTKERSSLRECSRCGVSQCELDSWMFWIHLLRPHLTLLTLTFPFMTDCSKECQRADWPTHKKTTCKRYTFDAGNINCTE